MYFNSLAVVDLPGFSSGPACGDLMVQCQHQDSGAIENHHALMSRIRRNAYGIVCNFQSWGFVRSLLKSYFKRSHLIKNSLNNTRFSCNFSLIEGTPFTFQGLYNDCPSCDLEKQLLLEHSLGRDWASFSCQEHGACRWFINEGLWCYWRQMS